MQFGRLYVCIYIFLHFCVLSNKYFACSPDESYRALFLNSLFYGGVKYSLLYFNAQKMKFSIKDFFSKCDLIFCALFLQLEQHLPRVPCEVIMGTICQSLKKRSFHSHKIRLMQSQKTKKKDPLSSIPENFFFQYLEQFVAVFR